MGYASPPFPERQLPMQDRSIYKSQKIWVGPSLSLPHSDEFKNGPALPQGRQFFKKRCPSVRENQRAMV